MSRRSILWSIRNKNNMLRSNIRATSGAASIQVIPIGVPVNTTGGI